MRMHAHRMLRTHPSHRQAMHACSIPGTDTHVNIHPSGFAQCADSRPAHQVWSGTTQVWSRRGGRYIPKVANVCGDEGMCVEDGLAEFDTLGLVCIYSIGVSSQCATHRTGGCLSTSPPLSSYIYIYIYRADHARVHAHTPFWDCGWTKICQCKPHPAARLISRAHDGRRWCCIPGPPSQCWHWQIFVHSGVLALHREATNIEHGGMGVWAKSCMPSCQ